MLTTSHSYNVEMEDDVNEPIWQWRGWNRIAENMQLVFRSIRIVVILCFDHFVNLIKNSTKYNEGIDEIQIILKI